MDYYTENPGPGTYKPKITLTTKQGALFTIGIRTKASDGDNMPGPGTYDPRIVDRREPAFSIQGRGDKALGDGNPGAGAYSPSVRLTKREGAHFTLGPQIPTSFETNNPGPGTYKPRRIGHPRAFTLGKRYDAEKQEDYPGPGDYKRPYVNWYKPGFTLGKRFPSEPTSNNPPPGTYNPRIPKIPWKKEGFTLGKRYDAEFELNYPGPGNYNDKYRSKPPAYTIAKRFVTRNEFIGPGAGEYDPIFVRGAPGFSMAARNDTEHDDKFPGPGAYDPNLSRRPGYTIAVRLEGAPPFNVPGAGTYYNPKLDKFTGPAYSLTGRGKSNFETSGPGPGAYEAVPAKPKGCVIATRLEDPDWFQPPGPGHYNLRSKSMGGGPSFTIATRFSRKPRPGEKGYIEPARKTF